MLARYNEPVGWALPLLGVGIDVTVLNRGRWGALDALATTRERARSVHEWESASYGPGRLRVNNRLANVGREGFAYLEHIVEHAHAWEHDITAFCQADPSCGWYRANDLMDDLRRLCGRAGLSLRPRNPQHVRIKRALRGKGFTFLSRCYPYFHPDEFLADEPEKRIAFRVTFTQAFNGTVAEYERLRWCPTSCIALTRQAISNVLKNKLGTLEELIRMLGKSNRPIEAEMLERAWGKLFDPDASVGLNETRSELPLGSSVPISYS